MLFRKPILERIKAGEVSLAFRRWKRPTVKSGSTLKTAVGVLLIQQLQQITLKSITASDAQAAGYTKLDILLKELRDRPGQVYRIQLAYAGDDPRIALRQDDDLSRDEFAQIVTRLQRLDARSPVGDWTTTVLTAIHTYPMTAAAQLAEDTGYEKDWLKTNIRKLKNLGLTISHQPGYELSPRGARVLDYMKRNT